jgi:hypothetical protein
MAKKVPKKAHKSGRQRELPPLTDVQQQVMAYVMNSITFESYDECCSVEAVAEHLGRTPGRSMPTLRKLVDKGYLTIDGEIFPWVLPTVEALRKQDPALSDEEARKILKRIKA